ncbi:MAG: phosphohydrolase [Clostridia bacterium]|nr:phosphohydrolase [Clostridia bacterium]
MVTLDLIQNDDEIISLIAMAENQLKAIGYTEHGARHLGIVTCRADEILSQLGFDKKQILLAKISAWLHDVGNAVGRPNHAQNGAIMAYNLLTKRGMCFSDATDVMCAIANHDEQTGKAISITSATVILADKSDVHRSRVRPDKVKDGRLIDSADIHDRVNFAVTNNQLVIDKEKKQILLALVIDNEICSTIDYFEIFLSRMRMCISAAQKLNCSFKLQINGHQLL